MSLHFIPARPEQILGMLMPDTALPLAAPVLEQHGAALWHRGLANTLERATGKANEMFLQERLF